MVELTLDEARVLGVLIEKALTTPAQYPLSLNAIAAGASQKSNRHPVLEYSEERCFDALDTLRQKRLANEVILSGSRVSKYRHLAREGLGLETPGLVLVTELMLRGPQTLGELRQNAGRMHGFDSTEAVLAELHALAGRSEPLARELPPDPGSRAPRWCQLLTKGAATTAAAAPRSEPDVARVESHDIHERVLRLEREVEQLRDAVHALARAAGVRAEPGE